MTTSWPGCNSASPACIIRCSSQQSMCLDALIGGQKCSMAGAQGRPQLRPGRAVGLSLESTPGVLTALVNWPANTIGRRASSSWISTGRGPPGQVPEVAAKCAAFRPGIPHEQRQHRPDALMIGDAEAAIASQTAGGGEVLHQRRRPHGRIAPPGTVCTPVEKAINRLGFAARIGDQHAGRLPGQLAGAWC